MDCNVIISLDLFELQDILFFFIRSIKHPFPGFNISNYITFNNSNTRSSNTKLCQKTSINTICSNSYFYSLPRLWNALPKIDCTLSFNKIKQKLKNYLYEHSLTNFNSSCTFHFYALVVQYFAKFPRPCNYNILYFIVIELSS